MDKTTCPMRNTIVINKFLSNLSEPGVKLTVKKGDAPQGLSTKSVKNYKILLSSMNIILCSLLLLNNVYIAVHSEFRLDLFLII